MREVVRRENSEGSCPKVDLRGEGKNVVTPKGLLANPSVRALCYPSI